MIETGTLWLVLSILFIATFIRSAFGFGEALVAVPLLALMIPVEVAVPVAVLVSITVAAVVVVQDWRAIHLRSAGWLTAATVLGTPLGLWLLAAVPGWIVQTILGVIIASFSLYCLFSRRQPALDNDRWSGLFGFGAGILGGAYGMNGPPLVVYGALRGWSPQRFRATLQAYFLPASLMTMGGYWIAGLWTPPVTDYFLWALPGVALAIVLGRAVNRRLDGPSFIRYIHIGLVLVSVVLLWQSLA